MDQLKGKRFAVIGGFGTLGKVLTLGLIDQGATVVVAEKKITQDTPDWFTDASQSTGRLGLGELDITSRSSIVMFLSAQEPLGSLDGMVNAAYPRNPHYGRKLEEVTYDDFNENVSLHLGGYFLAMQVFAEHFKKQDRGSIVNLSSIYGVLAPRFEVYAGTPMTMPVEYAAIKSGLIHLTKYFSKYYQGTRVRFNCVSPGGILDKQPQAFLDKYKSFALQKGMLDPQDIVGAVTFLLSDQSTYVKGQNLIVDDGWTL